ncbi:hypothetical protein KFK09_022587 [Dendrobium nobile]|uniref:Uncharacterized protein n=1 Tax=Dendrobium nobile TaxID=94219 RepID=A0A8T3AJ57_DENNO|nr:hypothetical protein KFK09_022587 [Dendrobium nobile]
MGFLTCNRSSKPVDRALPRIKTSSKKNNPSNRPEESLQPVPNKKTSDAFCELEIEDIDLEMQLKLAEGVSDESTCMWLSSDCDSSSLFSFDISDLCLLNGWTPSFIDTVPLMKSENADSTVLPLLIDLSGELSKEEGVMNDQSVCSYERRNFSYDRSLESSCTSLATMDNLDRSGTWISTFDLNLERSELIQLKDGVNSTYSDLSSPSCSYRVNSLSEYSFSSPSSITSSYLTETCGSLLGEFDYDEPLFWPYNQDMYESSELGKSFLCVSPRKEKKMSGKNKVNELKSVEVKPRKINNRSESRKIMQLQCGRRHELSQMPKKSTTGWKSIAPTSKNYNNSKRLPSQLSTSIAQASANLFPFNTLTKKRINSTTKETRLKSKNQRNKLEQLPIEPLLEFEASFFHDIFMKGATIEKIVGLNEFDALEWLNLTCSEGCFIESMKKEESSQAGIATFFLQL